MSFAISDPVSAVLNSALDGLSTRQQVIADNIANVDTPGYRATSVDFESALLRRHRRGRPDGAVTPVAHGDRHPGGGQRQQRGPAQGDPGRGPVPVPVPDAHPRGRRPVRPGPHRGGGSVMGAFDMLRIASSSLGMHQTWLDALANNIANVNTVTPHRRERLPGPDAWSAGARPGGGVEVAGIALGDAEGALGPRPRQPAGRRGRLRPRARDIDMASQMTQLVMAQRGFQASVQVTKDAQDTYPAPCRSDVADERLRHRGRRLHAVRRPAAADRPTGATVGSSGGDRHRRATGASGDFGNMVLDGIDRLEAVQDTRDELAVQAATGDLDNIHDYTIAATEASVTTQLTVAVRNKALEAFNEIMRMPV